LRACSAALQGVEILCQDFRDTPTPKKGDFWYADPPYWPLSDTSSFTSYTAGGFDSDKQAALAAYAEELRTAGVHVLLSNSSASPVRALYESHGFTCHEVSARRSVNSDASKRAAIKELLIW
jgi:DNA adenine methylase